MNFNKAIIAGNVTRDPDTRTLPSGQPVVSFGVATNRRYTDQGGNKHESVEFHNVVAFGKWADVCSRYLTKGSPVLVEGRLQTRSWEGQDGNKRSRTEIIMEFMQMGPRSGQSTPRQQQASPGAQAGAEEIPVVEAEEPISASPETEPTQDSDEAQEKVDPDKIPF